MVHFTDDAAHNSRATHTHRSLRGRRLVPKAADTHGRVVEILNASRVRWKFNHETIWNYGRPIAYTEEPSYIIERESDGVRVVVSAAFNPEPVIAATVPIPRDLIEQIQNAGADELGWVKAQLKAAAYQAEERPTDERRYAAMREFVEHPPAWAQRMSWQQATEAFLTGWDAAQR